MCKYNGTIGNYTGYIISKYRTKPQRYHICVNLQRGMGSVYKFHQAWSMYMYFYCFHVVTSSLCWYHQEREKEFLRVLLGQVKEHNVPCDQCGPAEFSRPFFRQKKIRPFSGNFRHFSEQFCHCALEPKIYCQWIATDYSRKNNVICCSGPQKRQNPAIVTAHFVVKGRKLCILCGLAGRSKCDYWL